MHTKDQLLLCFSHLRWDFVYQRPQHLLSRAAQGFRVIYFEEPVFEDVATARLETNMVSERLSVVRPVLPAGKSPNQQIALQRQLVDTLLDSSGKSGLCTWYYTPMALAFSDHLDPDVCVYDKMDELSAFRGAPAGLVDLERDLLARADVVFTGGRSLHEAASGRHGNMHLFPSSIDASHFRRARTLEQEPPVYNDIASPRLGFFGVIDERMDLELVSDLARLKPDWQFIFVGPVVKIDPATLPQQSNVHWLGGAKYEDLPAHLGSWDLGIMPFAINESTQFISPTKTPEFLAAGLQLVSTPIRDVVRPYGEMGLVEIADDADAFAQICARLMMAAPAGWSTRVDAHLAGMSWDRTWAGMSELITRCMANVEKEYEVV